MSTRKPEPFSPKRKGKGMADRPHGRIGPLPPKRNPPLRHSLIHALSGMSAAFFRERNLRVHLGAGAGALYFAGVFGLSRAERAILLLTVGLVVICELLNTAMEHLVDLAAPAQPHPLAKAAKDMAAGGVLMAALVSVGVGFCLFGDLQRLLPALQALIRRPLPPLLLAAAAWLLIVLPGRQNSRERASLRK